MVRVIENPTEEEALRFYPKGDYPLRYLKRTQDQGFATPREEPRLAKVTEQDNC